MPYDLSNKFIRLKLGKIREKFSNFRWENKKQYEK
jgi:hypothetical protein